jgi:hypothetical protein
MAPDGAYVVAWTDQGATFSVFAQPYDPAGVAIGGTVAANQTGFVSSGLPSPDDVPPTQTVTMACDGSFLVGWTDVGTAFLPFVRRFDPAGLPLGPEESLGLVPSFTNVTPWAAADPDGGEYVVAWTESGSTFQVHHEWFGP